MNIFAHSKRWLFFALVLVSLTLTSCTSYASHEWLEAPDWSRAVQIGVSESAYPVVPAIDEQGNSYFAIARIESNVPQIVVSSYNESLDLRWQQILDLERLNRANSPGLIVRDKGVEIFWILNDDLYSALYSLDGDQIGEVQRISGSRAVSYYNVSVDREGRRVLWFSGDRSEPGLYYVDPNGNIAAVDFEGYKPQIAIGMDNTMYAAWIQTEVTRVANHVFVAAYPNAEYQDDQEENVYTIGLSVTAGLNGPEIALDQNNLYIFWSEQSRTGISAGNIDSFYVTRSLESLETSREQDLGFPYAYHLIY